MQVKEKDVQRATEEAQRDPDDSECQGGQLGLCCRNACVMRCREATAVPGPYGAWVKREQLQAVQMR